MADINAMIAQGAQPVRLESPINMMAQLSQLQAAQGANQLRQMQMEQAMRQQEQENALAAMPYETLRSTPQEALRYGAPGRAMYGELLKGAKERREAELASARTAGENIKLSKAALAGVNSQEAYDAWRQYTTGLLPGLAQILPAEFSNENMRRLSLEADKLYENVIKEINQGPITQVTAFPKYGYGVGKTMGVYAVEPTALQRAQTEEAIARTAEVGVPASIRELRAFQAMSPEQQDEFIRLQAAKRPTTTISIDPGEKAESVERGKLYVQEQKDVGNAATAARKSLVGIETAQDVLNKGFETGFTKEIQAKAASVLATLGSKTAEKFATDAQTFLQAATKQVLDAQLEQKGVQTNQDFERIQQAGIRLGNTTAANKFILDVARAQAERSIARDKFYRDWLKDPANKKSLAGAEDAWIEKEGNKSIFESPRLKKYGVLEFERAQTAPAPQGPIIGARSAAPMPATSVAAPAATTAIAPEARAAALNWVQNNPDDPRSAEILKRLGVQ